MGQDLEKEHASAKERCRILALRSDAFGGSSRNALPGSKSVALGDRQCTWQFFEKDGLLNHGLSLLGEDGWYRMVSPGWQ